MDDDRKEAIKIRHLKQINKKFTFLLWLIIPYVLIDLVKLLLSFFPWEQIFGGGVA